MYKAIIIICYISKTFLYSNGLSIKLYPFNVILPLSDNDIPVIILINVLLPTPFFPKILTNSPL